MQDPKPVPQEAKKKKKKTRQAKATDAGLEGFMDWTNPGVSKSAEEKVVEIFGLAYGFAARICKRVASTQGKTALALKHLTKSVKSCPT